MEEEFFSKEKNEKKNIETILSNVRRIRVRPMERKENKIILFQQKNENNICFFNFSNVKSLRVWPMEHGRGIFIFKT